MQVPALQVSPLVELQIFPGGMFSTAGPGVGGVTARQVAFAKFPA